MTIKQTITRITGSFIILAGLLLLPITFSSAALAAERCGGVTTSIISCDETGGSDQPIENSGIWGLLLLAINILTAGIGVAALAGIVYGIVLYTTSSGDPAGIKKAMEVIRNVVIGIVAYALMFSLLQWLVPGGVFSNAPSTTTDSSVEANPESDRLEQQGRTAR